jgi:small-conductance mechanosensitive channel
METISPDDWEALTTAQQQAHLRKETEINQSTDGANLVTVGGGATAVLVGTEVFVGSPLVGAAIIGLGALGIAYGINRDRS